MEFVQQNLALVALCLTSGLMFLWSFFQDAGLSNITPAEATLLINREDAPVIDVREPAEFAAGHIAGARNLPLGKLTERMADLDKYKDQTLIICCAAGGRSARACGLLKKQGFDKLNNLAGGMDAWNQAGLPVKKGMKS
jgi:rhodanese-related sulfurtransferase